MPFVRIVFVGAYGGSTYGPGPFTHVKGPAEAQQRCIVAAFDIDGELNLRLRPVLIRHDEGEVFFLNTVRLTEALHGRVGIVQGIDILSGSRIDVQGAVLAFSDHALPVDGIGQVVQPKPFVVRDELVQLA